LAIEFEALSAEHLVQINDADVDALSASEVTCVCLPTSDLYMKCAYPPARKLIDKGARVALATDFNPGTAPSQDLALTGLLARLEMKMTLPEVAVAYTLGGAHALGLQKDLGSLEVGKFCDFVVLESDLEALFYEAGRQPIARVFREGKELQQS
jgi:imidazolonepropionase